MGTMKTKPLSLREIQLVSVEIMNKVDRICKEQNLRYYLYGGSLIGAVRHKGFIPWDDDIDIVMPRDDYEKFLEYFEAHSEELKPLTLMNNRNTEKYPYMISRVSNNDYYLDVQNEKPYGMGIFIDVYPWDGGGNSEKDVARIKGKSSKLSSLCYLSTRKKCIKDNTKSKIKLFIKPLAFLLSKILGRRFLQYRLEKISKTYDYNNSKYVGCVAWGCDSIRGFFPKKWLGKEETRLKFEGYSFRVPTEWDKCLTKLYGDYMKLPPKKAQVAHHNYCAYRKGDNE